MTNAVVVELTKEDIALMTNVMHTRGRALKQSTKLIQVIQSEQCFKIAKALCRARPLEDYLDAVEEHLTQL